MSPLLLLVVISLIAALIYKNWPRVPENYPPGPPRLPFIGSYLHLLWIDFYRPFIAMEKMAKHYGSPVVSFGMGSYNAIVVNDAETIRETFANPLLQGRVPAFPALLRTFGKNHGFFSDDGDGWLHFRRQSLRAMRDFGFGRRSDKFESVMEEEVKLLIEKLDETKGEPVLVPEVFFPTMFSLIIYLVHGQRVLPSEKENIKYLGKQGLRLITNSDSTGRLLAIWPWVRFIFPSLTGSKAIYESSLAIENFVRDSLKRHKSDFDELALRDLLDYYLKNKDENPYWTENNIIIGSSDLMFPNAAVSVVITSTLMFLAENKDKMIKCQEQIDEFVGRGRLPDLNDRQNLSMVEASIREALRIEVLAPLGVAHRATEDTTLAGYAVPKDSIVITNLHAMGRDPKLFEDPEEFRPERFVGPQAKDPTLPFGLGKRVCAGETFARQNMFVVVAGILQNFNLEIAIPRNPTCYTHGLAVAHNPDLALRFIPRS